jgi:hypothetical protein
VIRLDTLLYERYTKWIKGTIRYITLLGIALVALTPQRASSQFSDSTIKEINNRLLELHRCREKQSLYVKLALNDSILIHKQDSIIQAQTIATNHEKVVKYRYKTIAAFSSIMLLLALIL